MESNCTSIEAGLCNCPCCNQGSASPQWVQIEGVWALCPSVAPELAQGSNLSSHVTQWQPYQQQYYPQLHQQAYQQSYYQLGPAAVLPPEPAPALPAVLPAPLVRLTAPPAAALPAVLPAKRPAAAPAHADADACVVCLSAPQSHITLPCFHLIYCASCAAQMTARPCAVCMTPVTETKPVGQRLALQECPALAQGVMPLPPKHSDDAMVLDHCLDVLQALAKSDDAPMLQCANAPVLRRRIGCNGAEAASEAASDAMVQRVAASELRRADAERAQWVHIFAGSQCVGSAACTSTEQPSENALELQDLAHLSRVSGPEGVPYDGEEAPPSPCQVQ